MSLPTPWWSIALDVMTAFGTLGATVIALWLALPQMTRRLDAVFIWDASTDYKPILLVQNRGSKIIIIDSVEVFYDRSRVIMLRFSERNNLRDFSIIEAGATVKMPFDPSWLTVKKPSDVKKKKLLKIIIKPRYGQKCVSRQKYSFDELNGLFFGYGLFNVL